MRPLWVTRGGPKRSAVSAPRSKSKRSFARFVPIWSSTAAASVAAKTSGRNRSSTLLAAAAPTSTGATAASSVAGRTAVSQCDHGIARRKRALPVTARSSGQPRETREVRLALLQEGIAALLRLLAQVEEERGVTS